MKCTNCGAELEQGTMFCGSCGTPVQAPVQPQYQQAPVQPQRPLNKKQYIEHMASEKVKKSRKIAPIIALICALVVFIGYIVAANTALYDLPVLSLAEESIRDEMKEEMDDISDQKDKVEDRLEALEDIYSKKEMKIAEQCVDATLAVAETPSINNMQKLANALKKADGTDMADDLDIDGMEDVIDVIDILSAMLIVGLIWVLLFTVLAGVCKSKGLAVAGMIFSIFYLLPMAGVIWVILSVVAHVVLISKLGVADKEYAAYRKSLRA